MADFVKLGIEINTSGAKTAESDLNRMSSAAQRAEKSTQNLTNCLGRMARLVELSGIGMGIKSLLDMSDKMQSMANQVRFTTKSVEEFNEVQNALFSIAQKTGASLESTTQLYSRAANALRDYGFAQKDILKFTENINKTMAVGGATAQEQASAMLQLSQALGAGKLQGNDYKSISAAAPILLDTLAQSMGKTRAELDELASKGQITAEAVFTAFSGSLTSIEAQFAQMPLSFGSAMQMLQNSVMKLIDGLLNGSSITSIFSNVIAVLANNLNVLAMALASVAAGHLVKLAASMATTIQATLAQINADRTAALSALEQAKATQTKIAAELAYQQTVMASIAAQMKAAQSEQALTALRMQAARQAALINEIHQRNVVATTALTNAQIAAKNSTTALGKGVQFLGGKIGLIGIAVTAAWLVYDNFIADAQLGAEELGVTWGDAFSGVWSDFTDLVGEAVSWFSEAWSSLVETGSMQWDSFGGVVVNVAMMLYTTWKNWANSLIGAFVFCYETIVTVWNNFPAAMEALAKGAINGLISITESGINQLIELIKAPLDLINSASEMLGAGNLFDTSGWKIDLSGFKLQASTEAQAVGEAISKSFQNAATKDFIGDGANAVFNYLTDTAVRHKKNKQAESTANDIAKKHNDRTALPSSASGGGKSAKGGRGGKGGAGRSGGAGKTAALGNAQGLGGVGASGQDFVKEWQEYFSELERAGADSFAKIGYEQDRSLREMSEKAKKAGIAQGEVEKAKTLIFERYAKERAEIAEKYAPEMKSARELKEQLAEIENARNQGLLTDEQAAKANDRSRWDMGAQMAQQAAQNAVSGLERWRAEFDPVQEIANTEAQKLAELQSYYEQHLISYQDFLNRKRQIEQESTTNASELFRSSIAGFGSALETMTTVMANAKGEQSSIYKTMFAMSKSFAIADSMIKIQQAIASTWGDPSLPHTAKLAAAATVAAETANIISNIQGITMAGQAHSGIDYIPNEGTWLLDKGERVVDSRTNQDLKTFLANANNGNASGGKTSVNVKIINNGSAVNAKVSQQDTADGTQITVELLEQIDRIANNRYQQNLARDLRKGNVLNP